MEHAEQAEIAAEIARLASDVLQGVGALGKKRIVAKPLVGAEDCAQFRWDGERDQEVTDGHQPRGLRLEPGLLLGLAALIARAVTTEEEAGNREVGGWARQR